MITRRNFLSLSAVSGSAIALPGLAVSSTSEGFMRRSTLVVSPEFAGLLQATDRTVFALDGDVVRASQSLVNQMDAATLGVTTWLDYLVVRDVLRERGVQTSLRNLSESLLRVGPAQLRQAYFWSVND